MPLPYTDPKIRNSRKGLAKDPVQFQIDFQVKLVLASSVRKIIMHPESTEHDLANGNIHTCGYACCDGCEQIQAPPQDAVHLLLANQIGWPSTCRKRDFNGRINLCALSVWCHIDACCVPRSMHAPCELIRVAIITCCWLRRRLGV